MYNYISHLKLELLLAITTLKMEKGKFTIQHGKGQICLLGDCVVYFVPSHGRLYYD